MSEPEAMFDATGEETDAMAETEDQFIELSINNGRIHWRAG